MLIFIGNIPGDSPLIEVQTLVGDHKLTRNFSAQFFDDTSSEGYHFIFAKTDSAESAEALINLLSGKQFRGVTLEARHVIKRQQLCSWQGVNRRTNQLSLPFD